MCHRVSMSGGDFVKLSCTVDKELCQYYSTIPQIRV